MKKLTMLLMASIWLMSAASHASQMSLDFEGISVQYPFTDYPLIQDFYNGGSASNGQSGEDYGIYFSDSALAVCLNELGGDSFSCSNASRGGEGNASSAQTGLFFDDSTDAFINVADGFSDFFSFFYAGFRTGTIQLFDDFNGTGNLLHSIELSALTVSIDCLLDYGAGFCPFSLLQSSFTGVAKSISFSDVATDFLFDDLTFGLATTTKVNAPNGLIVLLVAGTIGVLTRKKADEKNSSLTR